MKTVVTAVLAATALQTVTAAVPPPRAALSNERLTITWWKPSAVHPQERS